MFTRVTLGESSTIHNVTSTFLKYIRNPLSKLFKRQSIARMPKLNGAENHSNTEDCREFDLHLTNRNKSSKRLISYLVRSKKKLNNSFCIASRIATADQNISIQGRNPHPRVVQSSPEASRDFWQVFLDLRIVRCGLKDLPQKKFVKCRSYLKDTRIRIAFLACCISGLVRL